MPVNYGSKPFKEQLKFFRDKLDMSTDSWASIWHEQHDRAFVIAGAMKGEVLTDIRGAIDSAIAKGTTLEQFRKDFDAVIAKTGWQYNGGRNWRTRIIYETNLRQAYNAGRYRQMEALKEQMPYWEYRHNDSVEHPRPEHLAWDGLVLAATDPWWNTHKPQNGWGCKCSIRPLSKRDMEDRGLTLGKAPPIEWEEHTVGIRGPHPRTVKVPKGIDPGFAYAPGQNRISDVLEYATARANAMPAEIATGFISSMVSTQFSRWYARPEGDYPIAVLPSSDRAAIGVKPQVALLSAESAAKQQKVHADLIASDYIYVQAAVDRGQSIQEGKSIIYVLEEIPGYVVVVKSTQTGKGLFVSSVRKLSTNQVKRDIEIRRLLKKIKK